ncbi:MAG: hypothetical protein IJ684_00040 [Bacteroidales bacterium]|nr:hypothetical protein [Bacteroidales bacterium]
MSKKAFIFIFGCLFSLVATGQATWGSAFEDIPNGKGLAITRALSSTESITYHAQINGTSLRGIFEKKAIGATSVDTINFVPGYVVHDFYIYGNTVYFCGSNPGATEAIIGYFDVSVFQNPGQVQNINCWTFPDATTLTKIVAFRRAGNNNVECACLGLVRDQSSGLLYHSLLHVDLTGQPSTFTAYFFGNGSLHFYTEWYSDLVVTDNYVAVVGELNTTSRMIMIRRQSLNQSTVDWNPQFYYTTPNNEMLAFPKAVRMEGDTLALASLCLNSDGIYEVRTRFVDLASMTMFCSQAFELQEKADPIAMTYVPKNHSLIMSISIGGICNLIRMTHLKTSGYLTWYITHSNKYFAGLCCLQNQYLLATSGNLNLYKHATIDPSATISSCYQNGTIKIKTVPNLTGHKTQLSIDATSISANNTTPPVTPNSFVRFPACLNP